MSINDPKGIVTSGYDRCAPAYAAARLHDPSPEIELLAGRLSRPARILDVGCGAGVPITVALARIGTVVAVDISATQIGLARKNVPSAQLIHGDIMDQDFNASSFDAVVGIYALFHLPRDEQRELIAKMSCWLRPGGYLLATLPRSDHPGYTENDFFGVTMYWSHYGTSWYSDQLVRRGFDIIQISACGHGYRDVPGLPPERHPVVFAQLRTLPDREHTMGATDIS